jgi:hypothetical protein
VGPAAAAVAEEPFTPSAAPSPCTAPWPTLSTAAARAAQ